MPVPQNTPLQSADPFEFPTFPSTTAPVNLFPPTAPMFVAQPARKHDPSSKNTNVLILVIVVMVIGLGFIVNSSNERKNKDTDERKRIDQALAELTNTKETINKQLTEFQTVIDELNEERKSIVELRAEFETQATLNAVAVKSLRETLKEIEERNTKLTAAVVVQERQARDEEATKFVELKKKRSEDAKSALVRHVQQQDLRKQRLLSTAAEAIGLLARHWAGGTLTKDEGKELMTVLRHNVPLIQAIEELVNVGGDIEVTSVDGRTTTFGELWRDANKQ